MAAQLSWASGASGERWESDTRITRVAVTADHRAGRTHGQPLAVRRPAEPRGRRGTSRYPWQKAARSRAVSRLISGQTAVKISVPCEVPMTWRQRAGIPACSSNR